MLTGTGFEVWRIKCEVLVKVYTTFTIFIEHTVFIIIGSFGNQDVLTLLPFLGVCQYHNARISRMCLPTTGRVFHPYHSDYAIVVQVFIWIFIYSSITVIIR